MSVTAGNLIAEKTGAPTLTYAQYLAEGEINRRYDILNGVCVWVPNPFGDRDTLDLSALDPAPELIVEVLSPSDTSRILADKIRDYRRVNVQECWIVSLGTRTVEVLRLTPEDERSLAVYAEGESVRSEAFPGLVVSVADVFAP